MTRRSLLTAGGAAASSTVLSQAVLSPGLLRAAEAKKQIKITGIETDVLRMPPSESTGDAIHDFGGAAGGGVLRIKTDAGITGWGYSNFGQQYTCVIQTILVPYCLAMVGHGPDRASSKRGITANTKGQGLCAS